VFTIIVALTTIMYLKISVKRVPKILIEKDNKIPTATINVAFLSDMISPYFESYLLINFPTPV